MGVFNAWKALKAQISKMGIGYLQQSCLPVFGYFLPSKVVSEYCKSNSQKMEQCAMSKSSQYFRWPFEFCIADVKMWKRDINATFAFTTTQWIAMIAIKARRITDFTNSLKFWTKITLITGNWKWALSLSVEWTTNLFWSWDNLSKTSFKRSSVGDVV